MSERLVTWNRPGRVPVLPLSNPRQNVDPLTLLQISRHVNFIIIKPSTCMTHLSPYVNRSSFMCWIEEIGTGRLRLKLAMMRWEFCEVQQRALSELIGRSVYRSCDLPIWQLKWLSFFTHRRRTSLKATRGTFAPNLLTSSFIEKQDYCITEQEMQDTHCHRVALDMMIVKWWCRVPDHSHLLDLPHQNEYRLTRSHNKVSSLHIQNSTETVRTDRSL